MPELNVRTVAAVMSLVAAVRLGAHYWLDPRLPPSARTVAVVTALIVVLLNW